MSKILIVEDESSISNLYTEILQGAGHEVLLLRNSEFVPANYYGKEIKLILLDVILPGKKNGFDILESIMQDEKLKKIPVVMLTNIDTERDVALDIGAREYVIKTDLKNEDLLALVNKYAPQR